MKKAKTPKTARCAFCGKEAALVQILIASQEGVHICEKCIDVAKQIADSKVGGTSGLHVIRKMPSEVARDTIALLRQMKDESVLTEEEYKKRCMQLIDQIAPTQTSSGQENG
jgi:ATP-dependent protease Clp ATPase subunit